MKELKNIYIIMAALLFMSMLGCASTSKTAGTGEYIDDSVITTKVKAAIFNEPTLKSAEINVETFKGTVQLSGFVSGQADISKAVEVAKTVEGVKAVKNSMQVK
jgi:osmotically-inducible protein OsmY